MTNSDAFELCIYYLHLNICKNVCFLQASRPIALKKENIQTRNRKVGKKIIGDALATPEHFWPVSSQANNETLMTSPASTFQNYLPPTTAHSLTSSYVQSHFSPSSLLTQHQPTFRYNHHHHHQRSSFSF